MITRRSAFAMVLGLATTDLASVAHASSLRVPSGKVILSVSGKVTETNQPGAAVFDLPMLESLTGTVPD